MSFCFSNPRKAGNLFLEWGPISGGANLHGRVARGHHHLVRWWLRMVIFVELGVGERVKTYGRRKTEEVI